MNRPDVAHITPRFRRFLSADLVDYYRFLLAQQREWSAAGCDDVAGKGIAYLGAPITKICHALAARAGGGGTVVTVLYVADGNAAGIEGYGY